MSNDTIEDMASFHSMTFDELLALRERLDAFLAERIRHEEEELESRLARIKRLKHSPSISDQATNEMSDAETRRRLPVRYRNPENPTQTWAGRGLQPRWLKQALKAGKKLSHFKVADA